MRVSVIVDIPGFNGPREVYRKEMQVSGYEEAQEVLLNAVGDLRTKDARLKKIEQEEETE